MTEPETAVLIVNFHTAAHVESLLRTLPAEPQLQVIVVDNSELDSEWRRVQDLASCTNHAFVGHRSLYNVGFGAAMNVAAAFAAESVRQFVCLNPDTQLVTKSFVAEAFLRHDHGIDVVAPTVVTGPDRDTVWIAGGQLDDRSGVTHHFDWGKDLRVLDDRPHEVPVSFVSGAAFSISREAWLKLGGFREDLFLYWEDADLCMRADELGMRISWLPHYFVWHLVGASQGQGKSTAYHYYFNRNRIVVFAGRDRHRWPLLNARAVRWTLYFLWRAAREPREPGACLRQAIRGLVQGYRYRA